MTKQELMLCRLYAYTACFCAAAWMPGGLWHKVSFNVMLFSILMIAIKIAEGATRDKSGTKTNQPD